MDAGYEAKLPVVAAAAEEEEEEEDEGCSVLTVILRLPCGRGLINTVFFLLAVKESWDDEALCCTFAFV